jgi:hypothetical protein
MIGAGGLVEGVSAFEAGSTRHELMGMNADIADMQARSEEETGNQNAAAVRLKGRKIAGQQISAIGANNLTQGGTNVDVVADTARANELDALTVANNANRRAWGFEVQAGSDRYQGKLAEDAGLMSGAGDILGAAGYMATI